MKKSNVIRYIALILSFVMIVSLFACNGNDSETESGETDSSTNIGSSTEDTVSEDNTSNIESADNTETSSTAETDLTSESDGNTETETNKEPTTESDIEENTDIIYEFESLEKVLYLSVQKLTVFNIPSISGESSETLSYGEEIHVVGINTYTGWYKIQLDEDKFGYISSDSKNFSETDPLETEAEGTGSDIGEGETEPCVHPYAATEAGHYKPACSICGKGEGRLQNHEFKERIDDGGDLWIYSFVCTICKYVAYEQEVPYEINSFYAPGELSGMNTDSTLSGAFSFEMGTGFAQYTRSSAGNGTVNIVDTGSADSSSGKYVVLKVRTPSSQNTINVAVKSVGASSNYTMSFDNLKPGWVTVIADMTTAVDTDSNGKLIGYQQGADGEYYLGHLSISCRVLENEHLDIAYVMICDTVEQARTFAKNEKQVYIYSDVKTGDFDFVHTACFDKDGNEIKHNIIANENGHTVTEPCYQCGLAAVENEPHVFAQMEINGDLTYACTICEYLQYGYNLNKYFSSDEISNNALSYYKVTKVSESEGEHIFPRFYGKGTTAQIIFARNNWGSTQAQEAAAFSVGKATLLVVRVRTNAPDVEFAMMLGGAPGKEKKLVFPTQLATVVSEEGADSVEYGWMTYVIDLPIAIPSVYTPDENGEYKLHNFYFQMGESGSAYTSEVYYDIDYAAFVDSWDEIKLLVKDDTVVKVNSTKNGTLVNTQEQKCIGEHSFVEAVNDRTYTYACANCGTPLKSVDIPESVTRYFSGYEIAMNATDYAAPSGYVGTRVFENDEDGTVYARINNFTEVWWMRHQQDFTGGTGSALNNKFINVGKSKYLVVRMRADINTKAFEFYMSTTGRNGAGYSVAEDGTVTRPTKNGYTYFSTPLTATPAGEWATYVFDLEMIFGDYYVPDPETGDYILDTFAVTISKDYNPEIEYMAFVDGSWPEIAELTSDETVVFVTHYRNKTYAIMDAATGKCADGQHSYAYSEEKQDSGSMLCSYTCGGCGDVAYSKTVPASVTKYFSGNDVAFGATSYAANGTKLTDIDDGVFFGRVADHEEIWWMRHQQDFKKATGNSLNNKFMDVGASKYFVVRIKTSNASQWLSFYMSTTGKNGEGYSVSDDGTITRPTTNGYTSLSLMLPQTSKTGEWTTYVFNLEEVFADYYVKDPETGHYIIDTFAIAYGTGFDADFEFIAFVDGDWSDIGALTTDETVVYITDRANKTFVIKDADTGENVTKLEFR